MSEEEDEEKEEEFKKFHVKIDKKTLRKVVNNTIAINDEVVLDVNDEYIEIETMDPGRVGMIDLIINNDPFDKYNVDEQKIGVNMDKIAGFFPLAEEDIIEIKKLEGNRLMLKSGNMTRKMQLLDTDGLIVKNKPDIDFDNDFTIKGKYLLRGIKASDSISDQTKIEVIKKDNHIKFYTKEGEDEVEYVLSSDKMENYDIDEDTTGLFDLEYFKDIFTNIGKKDVIELGTKEAYPIQFQFKFADGNGDISFLVAPRVSAE